MVSTGFSVYSTRMSKQQLAPCWETNVLGGNKWGNGGNKWGNPGGIRGKLMRGWGNGGGNEGRRGK